MFERIRKFFSKYTEDEAITAEKERIYRRNRYIMSAPVKLALSVGLGFASAAVATLTGGAAIVGAVVLATAATKLGFELIADCCKYIIAPWAKAKSETEYKETYPPSKTLEQKISYQYIENNNTIKKLPKNIIATNPKTICVSSKQNVIPDVISKTYPETICVSSKQNVIPNIISNVISKTINNKIINIATIKTNNEDKKWGELIKKGEVENAAVLVIKNAFKEMNKKYQITNDEANLFIKTMKKMITKHIDGSTYEERQIMCGSNVGFTEWKDDISKELSSNDQLGDDLIKKFQIFSAEIQKCSVGKFDTIRGRKSREGRGARSFRIIDIAFPQTEKAIDFIESNNSTKTL